LLKRDLFRLPFPVIFIVSPGAGLLAFFDDVRKMLVAVKFSASDCGRWVVPETGDAMQCVNGSLSAGPLRIYQNGDDFYDEDVPVGVCSSIILAAVTLLMSRDVEQKVTPAPAALNKRRAKKGKLPIGETRVVTIRAGVRFKSEGDSGTHASPVIHWRRGHFRKLRHERFKGDGERVIPVAPCLVGANDDAASLLNPKEYKI